MQETSVLSLDGDYGEGGGQILRTALFLSLLTGRGFRIERIRQKRRQPGLKPQHVGIIRLLQEMTQSQATGVHVGAPELDFQPGRFRAGTYRYDIGTAGSIPLFLQTILPVMLATPGRTELVLVGGTDVTFGPTVEWVRRVYAPLLSPLASELSIEVQARGFYPKGGGTVRVRVETALDDPAAFPTLVGRALHADRLHWTEPAMLSLVSVAHRGLEARRVAERQASAAQAVLSAAGHSAAEQIHYVDAFSMGSSFTLVAEDKAGNRMGADGLGALGVSAEAVGERVAQKWLHDRGTGATVDEHLADHLVPWVALGAGAVRVPRSTGHLVTNLWVCRRFLGAASVRLEGLLLRGRQK